TLRDLAFSLGGLFWRDLERHHPGISSLHLAPEVAAAWKQRILTKTRSRSPCGTGSWPSSRQLCDEDGLAGQLCHGFVPAQRAAANGA
ncbi:MAG TPA: hypothetical protein VFH76_34670, partial [Kribbella sp.]|nr:hypothetical protein [Kribbella sp.]